MKRIVAVFLVVLLLLSAAPLLGFDGIEIETRAAMSDNDHYLPYYFDIIKQYQSIMKNKFYYGKEFPYDTIPDYINYEWAFSNHYDGIGVAYYSLYDLNNDGFPELIISGNDIDSSNSLIGIYTYTSGKVVTLADSTDWYYRISGFIHSTGTISSLGSGGYQTHAWNFYTYKKDSKIPSLSQVVVEDGIDGTMHYYKDAYKQYDQWTEITKKDAESIFNHYTGQTNMYGVETDVKLAWKNISKINTSVTVSTPTGLKVNATNTTSLNLTWNKVSGATGYVVYHYNASTKKYTKLGATKTNSYKATHLKAGTTYQFAVKAYKTVDGKNYYSGYSSILKTMTVDPSPFKYKYNNVLYRSAAYDDFEDNSSWQTVEETVIKSGQFDWANAVVGAISANGVGDALGNYYDIRKGSAIDNIDLAGSIISMAHGFVCGGREGINDVTMKLQTNGKDNRMLLMYGQPIETAYGGQTLYYSEVLTNAHSGDASYVLYAKKDADKHIRNIFSGLEPDGRYDLKIKYSKMKDWEDSSYKYTIIIGNNGKVIQYPIFHNGTKVELCYYAPKGKKGYSTDITRLLNSETIEVEEQVGKDIINFLNSSSWKKNPKSQKISTGYDHYSKTLGNGTFSLNAKAKTALSYTSDNKKVVTVNAKGKATIVGVGAAKIKIVAIGTNKYNSATKYVTITVRPKTPTISKISRTAVNQAVVKWKKIEGASGYKIQYSTNKDMSGAKTVRITNGTQSSYTIKGMQNKKYYVRVAAYQTVNKVNYISTWSKLKAIKAK